MNAPTSGIRDAMGAVGDVDEGKRQVQVVLPWETLDSFHTDFSRDCFDTFLSKRLPAMAWCHQKTEPIGRVVRHQKGARAHEMIAEFSDFDAVPRSRQAFSQIADKHLTDFSYTFTDAKAMAHPNERGAIRFTEARMPEISPVILGSIPGAVATGTRAAADAGNLAELIQANVISADEARQILGLDALPEGEREVITITQEPTLAESIAEAIVLAKTKKKGKREAPDEPVSDEPVTGTSETPEDVLALAGSVDAALALGVEKLAGVDVETLDPDVQAALEAFTAGSVASNAMLDAMGVPPLETADAGDGGRSATETDQGSEPDDAGERAAVSSDPWDPSTADYTPAQWKAACLIVNGDGSTKDQCSLPVREPDGTLNKNGVVSAAKMIGHIKGASADVLQAAARKLMSLLSQVGEKPTPSVLALASGNRSVEAENEDAEIEAAMALARLTERGV